MLLKVGCPDPSTIVDRVWVDGWWKGGWFWSEAWGKPSSRWLLVESSWWHHQGCLQA
jgi:hypothetical protein